MRGDSLGFWRKYGSLLNLSLCTKLLMQTMSSSRLFCGKVQKSNCCKVFRYCFQTFVIFYLILICALFTEGVYLGILLIIPWKCQHRRWQDTNSYWSFSFAWLTSCLQLWIWTRIKNTWNRSALSNHVMHLGFILYMHTVYINDLIQWKYYYWLCTSPYSNWHKFQQGYLKNHSCQSSAHDRPLLHRCYYSIDFFYLFFFFKVSLSLLLCTATLFCKKKILLKQLFLKY